MFNLANLSQLFQIGQGADMVGSDWATGSIGKLAPDPKLDQERMKKMMGMLGSLQMAGGQQPFVQPPGVGTPGLMPGQISPLTAFSPYNRKVGPKGLLG